jgi:hypothetical protein
MGLRGELLFGLLLHVLGRGTHRVDPRPKGVLYPVACMLLGCKSAAARQLLFRDLT